MISAKEARKKVDNCEDEVVKKEISRIEEGILSAITEGMYTVTIHERLKDKTIEYLQKLGYEVNIVAQYNEPYTLIKF